MTNNTLYELCAAQGESQGRGGGIYDIGIRGYAQERSNPDPKIWVHQKLIRNFSA